MEPTNTPPRRAGPRGDPRQRPAVQLASAPASTPTRRPRSRSSASTSTRPDLDARIEARYRRAAGRRLPRRGASPASRPRPLSPHRGPGPRLQGAARPRPAAIATLDDAVALAVQRTRRFALPPAGVVPPRSPDRAGRRPTPHAKRLLERLDDPAGPTDPMRLTKHHGLGNDFLVTCDPRSSTRRPPSPCRPHPGHRRRRAAAPSARPTATPTSPWSCTTPTAAGPR